MMRWLLALLFVPSLLSAQDSVRTYKSEHVDSVKTWYTRIAMRTDTVRRVDTLWRTTPAPTPVPTPVPVPIPVPPSGMVEKALTGTQGTFDTRTKFLAAKTLVNADKAVWSGQTNNPINWAGGPGGVWRGGSVTGTWNQQTTPWDSYHSITAMHVRVDSAVVLGFRVSNMGDGVRFMDHRIRYFTLRDSWIADAHDDCMEDDLLKSGLVEGNLFDGCYQGLSMRPAKADEDTVTGVGDTVVVRNNLLRIKAFALAYKSTNSSGGFFKTGSTYPDRNVALVLEGNIFRADALPGVGTLCLNQHNMVTRSSGNILVWLGAGNYPCALPTGWTMTRDSTVWTNAVAAWKARH